MPSPTPQKIYSLVDYLDLLRLLAGAGLELATIGGCAVGSYAHQLGATILSGDLDLFATPDTLEQALRLVQQHGSVIRKRPQPRNTPVAFFDWKGKEVNILTSTIGLPDPDAVIRTSRIFEFGDVSVLVADPFDLLNNKLKVHRDKDLPHIELLLRFVTEEVVAAFERESSPRERIAPARRLLRVTEQRVLAPELADRLLPLARTPADWRFLMQTVPDMSQSDTLLASAPADLRAELETIRRSREWPPGI